MIAWFAKNHVAANLLMLTIVFLGYMSLSSRIVLEVFPSFELDSVEVSVALRGATPEDVELGITVRIEEAIQDLEGVKSIFSRSSEGQAYVRFELESGYDKREMLADVKARVDAINTFPVDAEKPLVSVSQYQAEVITAVVAADLSEEEIRLLAEQVRDDLVRLPGVTQVQLDGVRDYEIAIEVSPDRLNEYGLSLSRISQAIRLSSLDISGGAIKAEGGEVLIRSKGQAYNKEDFNNIVVTTQADGSILRIGDIATVVDGFDESPVSSYFNGKRAAFVDVYRVGNQGAIQLADQVKKYVEQKQHSLPDSVELSYWRDRSKVVKQRLQTLTNNAIQGGILVILLLTIFLRPSVAIWVFVGVPISFMGALILLPSFGVSLNVVSLFGFILVLGVVVDDAIVTGENVYTHLKKTDDGLEAAIRGTQEIAVPVTFGVLTTIAAFIPIMFIEGARGKIFGVIPLVVIPVLIFSLIESKLILPAHLKHIKIPKDPSSSGSFERLQQGFANGFERIILFYYQPALQWVLGNRYFCFTTFLGVLYLIITLLNSGWLNFTFFPRVQSEIARVSLTMPVGTPYEVTARHIEVMTEAAFDLKDDYLDELSGESIILDVMSVVGSRGGSHSGRVMFQIMAPEDRADTVTSAELVRAWRKKIGVIPGAESLVFRAEIGRASDPIDVELIGSDLLALQKVSDYIKGRLATYPSVFDITDSLADGKEELQLVLKPEAYVLGLNRMDVLSRVRDAFFGLQIQRIQRGRDDVRVIVRFPLKDRQAVASLQNLEIQTAAGSTVPLAQIADFVLGNSPSAINRKDRYRVLSVTADIDKEETNMTVLLGELTQEIEQFLVQYPSVSFKLAGEAEEQRESFGSLAVGSVFVLFVIYTLLAIPLKSYTQPIIIMSIIPFGIIGAVLGHLIMGMNLTILSALGILALVGIVVNDSLVLVDFINKRLERGGASLRDAVASAGAARFRPVMLTSLTTFIGLMPLLFEKSTQAQFLIPMAVSLGFGILFATVLTLFFVPINYLIVEDIRDFIVKLKLSIRNKNSVYDSKDQ